MKAKAKRPKKGVTLEETVQAAHAAGVKISYSLEPREDMPLRFPSDTKEITLLVEESERCNALGNRWANAKVPNPLAAESCWRMGWGFALAAAWLRTRLKGELGPEAMAKDQEKK